MAPRRSQAPRDPETGEIIEQPDPFFPGRGQSFTPAQMVCGSCKVRLACKGYNARVGNEHGVWAGNLNRRKNSSDTEDEE